MNGVTVSSQINLLTEQVPVFEDAREQIQRFAFACHQGRGMEKTPAESTAETGVVLQTMAHELKHPLGLIVNAAEILREFHRTMPNEELELWFCRIVHYGFRMNSIIDELLLLSSLTEAEVKIQPLNMADIVRDTRQYLAEMIEAYQARIVGPTTWPVAMGYAPWIERVWANYLSNAMKYGSRPVRIELGATKQPDGMVRLWVRDHGPGLTPAEQARLFRPFTRPDPTRAEGHGLGLSIVQYLVQALGGQVGVESEGVPGRGSVFFFTLPVCDE